MYCKVTRVDTGRPVIHMARQEMTVAFHLGRWRDVDRFEVYFGDGNHKPCDRLEVVEESFMTSGFPGG